MKTPTVLSTLTMSALALLCACAGQATTASGGSGDGSTGDQVRGWLNWRGPEQVGTSLETGLPETASMDAPSWTYDLRGRGTPVIGNGRVFTMGYTGERAELIELLACLDAETGKLIWRHDFNEFLTDSTYYRYAIGSPTIDPETGNVFCMTTAGLVSCFTPDGELIWQRSMMSEYGRLSFPNGRTGSVLIDGDLAIIHVATSNWGSQSPARDRFFAFDKHNAEPIWSCTPGGPPKDSSFARPIVETADDGRRVMYAGLAGGNLACVDVRTGEPLWRYQMSVGGLSMSSVLYEDSVIAVHGKENLDSSRIGRMIRIKRDARPEPGDGPVVLTADAEVWRNPLVSFTSSPVLVGNRVYQTVLTGDLHCVDADTGKSLWHEKLAPDQIHASPAYGDGKLYVPMNNGMFFIIRPSDQGPERLHEMQLEGNCLGAPAIADGRIYVHTTTKLYCFAGGTGKAPPEPPMPPAGAAGAATQLQVIPADILLRQGDSVSLRVRSLDALGRVVSETTAGVEWTGLAAGVSTGGGKLAVAADAPPSAAVVEVAANGLSGIARFRVVPKLPFTDDFEDAVLSQHPAEADVLSAPPRPYWAGANSKWEIREFDGGKALAKSLDNPLFQRTMSFIGHPEMSNYTMQVDIWADGNRRMMAAGGVVNQRYLILLKGNHQEIEVSSNMELLKETKRFSWKQKTWYTLKTRVDILDDGTGMIRVKAWQRDQPEPEAWTFEVPHSHPHLKGSPGIWGLAPQSRVRVYIDNISVTPND